MASLLGGASGRGGGGGSRRGLLGGAGGAIAQKLMKRRTRKTLRRQKLATQAETPANPLSGASPTDSAGLVGSKRQRRARPRLRGIGRLFRRR